MELVSQRYGKKRVRVLRVVREGALHTIHEIEAAVLLEGKFSKTYLTGDNQEVVPTDTVKNTVQVLAQKHLGPVLEEFALTLGDHFLEKYAQIDQVQVELTSRPWKRYVSKDGVAHPHTFLGEATAIPFTRLVLRRNALQIESGVRELLLLKSTASSFAGYPKCEFTTLPETQDRILATEVEATWAFADREVDFTAANAAILPALLETFATEFSPSLQNTLFLMAQAALRAAPDITQIHLAMPNKHYLPVNFAPFEKLGFKNANEIFLPTDEPHGQIEARITRAS